jgi:NADH-quinone oxidoreductase subunit M
VKRDDGRAARNLTVGVLVVEALLGLALCALFESSRAGLQLVVDRAWIPAIGARFAFGIDGISLVLVVMTVLLMPLALLGGWTEVRENARGYYATILAVTAGMVGVFVATDLLLFYLMWELALIPMYFVIGVWGGERGSRAGTRYFIYVMAASLLMLLAIVVLGVSAGSTRYEDVVAAGRMLPLGTQLFCFLAFVGAFAAKSAMWPLHTWSPDASREATPTGAASLSVKVGTYAMLRFALPLFPAAAMHPTVRSVIVGLGVVSLIYGAIVAMAQTDLRRLIAYSSVSHIGLVMIGIFAATVQGIQGATLVMVNAGITTGALFVLSGMLESRRGSPSFAGLGGMVRAVPALGALMTLILLADIGLPGTNGFVGEFLVLLGAYRTLPYAALVAAFGVIFTAGYALRALQRVLYDRGPADAPPVRGLDRRELAVLGAFAVAAIWLGVAPGAFLRTTEGAASNVVRMVGGSPDAAVARVETGR